MADGYLTFRDKSGTEYQVKMVDIGGGRYAFAMIEASTPTPIPVTITVSNAELLMAPNGTQPDQRLTVDATAGGMQFSAFQSNTLYVLWTCEDAQCRVTFDGSAPTSTNGHIINVGDSGVWSKALAVAAKWIRTGTTSAVIHASQLL